jgi:hypothetical protein
MTDTLIMEGASSPDADSSQATATAGAQAAVEAAGTQQAGEVPNGEGEKSSPDGEVSKPAGAPDKYEFTAPEGREFDPHVIAQFAEVAKELNLPQDAAQKVIDKIAPALAQRQAEQIEAAHAAWAEASRADKDFGGDKLKTSLATAQKALGAFGTPELRTLLNDSGLGNHPDVIRFLVKAGAAISDDTFVGGKPSSPNGKSLADRLYS